RSSDLVPGGLGGARRRVLLRGADARRRAVRRAQGRDRAPREVARGCRVGGVQGVRRGIKSVMSETSRHLSQIRNRLVGREIKKVEWQVGGLGPLDGLVLG